MSASFDHRQQGTPERDWLGSGLELLPRLAPPVADASILVLAAHPDDETLGAGALMYAAAARGAKIRVLIATDGEASHPGSASHSPTQLAVLRRNEVIEAVAAVAPSASVEFLGLPDGALSTCHEVLRDAIRDRLDGCTLLVSPWSGDGHPDHEAGAVAMRAAANGHAGMQHWQYPIWAWLWTSPDSDASPARSPGVHRLEMTPSAARAKRTAMACHRSQHAPLSAAEGDEAILPPHVLSYFTRDFETFVVEGCDVLAPASRAAYFDALYARAEDPWGLRDRFYESRKRELLLASLPRARFGRAFEPGCATGRLTTRLADRCAEILAWDGASVAVRQARMRVANSAVVVEQRRIPNDWPHGEFELIVLSEIAYYCPDLELLTRRVRECLTSDGVLVACHWNHSAADHPHTAQQVHDVLGAALHPLAQHREQDFLLDVWTVRDQSVAAAEGIVP